MSTGPVSFYTLASSSKISNSCAFEERKRRQWEKVNSTRSRSTHLEHHLVLAQLLLRLLTRDNVRVHLCARIHIFLVSRRAPSSSSSSSSSSSRTRPTSTSTSNRARVASSRRTLRQRLVRSRLLAKFLLHLHRVRHRRRHRASPSSSVKSTRDASRPLASSHLGRARRLGTSVDASRRRRDARRGEGRRKRRRKIYMFYSSELLCAKGALGQIWVRGASRERD